MATALILNIAFAVPVLAVLLGRLTWSILTQQRDPHLTLGVERRRRQVRHAPRRRRADIRVYGREAWSAS